jgi:hypothetical protein
MPTPTTYSSNLVFGGRIDSSLDKSVKQIENLLRQTNKETVAFQESISSIGTGILAVGTAFLGLRTGLDMFEDLADKGAQLSDLTNKLKNNLAGFSSLKAPISDVVSQFDAFNVTLRQTELYSTKISETFETAFTGKGYNPQITMRMTKLLEQVEAGRREKLTPEQAEGTVSALDAAIRGGSQESVIELNRQLGLKLNPGALMGVPNTPGNPNVAYGAREAILEQALKNVANPNAGLEARRDPRMAGYLFGQEQTEIAGKLGLGTNDLFAPVQQEMTKALKTFEDNGELEKFDVWSKDAGQRLSSFFQKMIEPRLPGALQKLEDLIDAIVGKSDKLGNQGPELVNGDKKDEGLLAWHQDPKTEQHIHYDKLWSLMGDGWNAITGSVNKDFQKSLGERLHTPASSTGMVSPTSVYDTVPAFASGGIVTRPTIGLIGEKEPEGVFPLSFLGSDTKDLTKANTEATKKATDALTALTQKLDDNLSLLRQQGQFQTLGQMLGQIPGQVQRSGGGRGGGNSGTSGDSGVPTPQDQNLIHQGLRNHIPYIPGKGIDSTAIGSGGASGPYRLWEAYTWEKYQDKHGPSGAPLQVNQEVGLSPNLIKQYGLTADRYNLSKGKHPDDWVNVEGIGWRPLKEVSAAAGGNAIEFFTDKVGTYSGNRKILGISHGHPPTGYNNANPAGMPPTVDPTKRVKGSNSLEPDLPSKTRETPSGDLLPPVTTHYSPHVAVTVHGHGDVNTIETAVKRALAQHGEELGHHIRRTLQDEFRRDQRVNYA